MRPEWTTSYLNIPFKDRGRDRSGVDCYGLVCLIYQEQRNISLPSYTESYTTADDHREILALSQGEIASRWVPIPLREARLYDGIVLRIKGQPAHFGMILDDEFFLHTMKNIWSVAERWRSLVWRHRVVEVLRYVG